MTEKIEITLDTSLLISVSMAKGWTPTIEDLNGELVGDEYPTIPNPVTYQMFIQELIPTFIRQFVLEEGRKRVNNDFTSISENIKFSVNKGNFDEYILKGDLDGIKSLVVNSLL